MKVVPCIPKGEFMFFQRFTWVEREVKQWRMQNIIFRKKIHVWSGTGLFLWTLNYILNESFLFYPCSQKKITIFYVILMILSKEMELKSLLYFKSKDNLHCKHLYCVQVFAVVARNICKLNVLLQGLTDVGGQIFICDLVGKQDHNGDPKRKLPPFISTTLNVLKRFHHVNF